MSKSVIIFELLKSLNMGNANFIGKTRLEVAEEQYEQMEDAGYIKNGEFVIEEN